MQERVIAGHSLSPQQVRLWLLQHGRQSTPYNARCAVVIEGELDRETLREALRQTVSRHEILFQVVADDIAPDLQERDLSHLPQHTQEYEIESLSDGRYEEERMERRRMMLVFSVLLLLGFLGAIALPKAFAQPLVLCSDPRGCPDLTIDKNRLRQWYPVKATF